MNPEQYMEERVDDQFNWFERKSSFNQKRYKRIKMLILIAAGLIPFLSGCKFLGLIGDIGSMVAGLLGVFIAVSEGLLSIHKYQENWLQYRSSAEALKREKLLYLTQVGPYADNQQAFPRFVQNVEDILQEDNSAWKSYIIEEKKDPDKEK